MRGLLCLVLLSVSIPSVRTACANAGYTQMGNGDCFKVYAGASRNFADAEATCIADGGHLASVHFADENAFIGNLLPAGTSAFIGLKCTSATTCTWSDNSAYDYNAFSGGAPVVAYGQCVYISTDYRLWYSTQCASLQATFVCRVKTNTPTNGCGTYTSYNGACIKVFTTPTTTDQAENNCQSDGGHLGSIHNSDENTVYQQLAAQAGITTGFIVGLKVYNGVGTWTDQTQYNFANWANLFPSERFGNCVQVLMSTELGAIGQWSNVPCNQPEPYICKKQPGTTPTLSPMTCPNVALFEDAGAVYSPGFPVSMPSKIKCEYLLTAPTGSTVSVKFPRFSTDAGTTLGLYEGIVATTPFVTLTSVVDPNNVYKTNGNVLKMVFQSSNAPVGSGWEADFATNGTFINPSTTSGPAISSTTITPTTPELGDCPEKYYVANTTLFSPNYPNFYPQLSNCNYYVQSPVGKRIRIVFGAFNTAQYSDIVSLYDGGSTADPLIATVSGKHDQYTVSYTSSGSFLTLNFISSSNYYEGWWYAGVYNV